MDDTRRFTGLMAKHLGLPIDRFVASSNRNNIVPKFLETGEFKSKPSVATISNAMDVGNPSNFYRILHLYNGSLNHLKEDLIGFSFSDAETRNTIWKTRDKYGYVLDPHGAVGFLGLQKALEEEDEDAQGIFLETAHPSKFKETVEPVLQEKINFPENLQTDFGQKMAIPTKNNMESLTEILLT